MAQIFNSRDEAVELIDRVVPGHWPRPDSLSLVLALRALGLIDWVEDDGPDAPGGKA